RMADEDHPLEPKRFCHRLNITRQSTGAPLFPVLARFAMARLIEGNDLIIAGEHIDLMLPVLPVAAPAMHEDKGSVALAADLANDAQSIFGTDRFLGRLGVALADQREGNQQQEAKNKQQGARESGIHGDLSNS